MALLSTTLVWLVAMLCLCQAQFQTRWTGKTRPVLGRVAKSSEDLKTTNVDSDSTNLDFGSAVLKMGGAIGPGTLDSRDFEVLDSRQTCPPTHPVPCAGGLCCQAAFPVCCIAQNGGCCPSAKPVCVTGGCCPSGTTLCPNDPNTCKTAAQVCCGSGRVCPVGTRCCGLNDCCPIGSEEAGKCCAISNPLTSFCAGEYDVCCDGWTCPEGSTCSSERNYCEVPVLEYGYQGPNSLTADLVRNTCLGIRGQMAMGRPNTAPNYQLLTYAGPNSGNRELTDCRSSRRCCTGQVVPPGKPGAGDPTQCDEYPFNSAVEGGPGAHVACVSSFANGGGGQLVQQMVAGKHRGFQYWLVVTGIDCSTIQESDIEGCNP